MNRRGIALLATVACVTFATGSAAVAATANAATTEAPSAAKAAESSGRWTAAVPVPGLAALNVGHDATLSDIACASTGNCAAGGSYTDRAGHLQAWIASEVRGRWHAAQEVPGTAKLDTGSYAAVNLIACPALDRCLAVGVTDDKSETQSAFVATEAANGTWTAARPVGAGMDVTAIACPRAGDCVLGGASATGQAAVSAEHGAGWSAPLTLPGVAALGPQGSSITALTCSSPGNCLVAGAYGPAGSSGQQVFVASKVKGAWRRAVQVPGTARLNSGDQAQLGAISCSSAGNCAVGGSYETSVGLPYTFVANEVRGSWDAARTIPGSADPTMVYGATVSGLRCTGAATCLAVGSAGVNGFIAQEKGGTWGRIRLVRDLTGYGTWLTAVSCRSAGDCLVTGGALLGSEDTSDDPGAESFGIAEIVGIWGRPKVLTVAHGGRTDSIVQSCDGSGDCVVGGNVQYGDSYQTVPATLSGYVASYTP